MISSFEPLCFCHKALSTRHECEMIARNVVCTHLEFHGEHELLKLARTFQVGKSRPVHDASSNSSGRKVDHLSREHRGPQWDPNSPSTTLLFDS